MIDIPDAPWVGLCGEDYYGDTSIEDDWTEPDDEYERRRDLEMED